jgi:AraC-like DNA-binding protein
MDGGVDNNLSVLFLSVAPRLIDCVVVDECRTGMVLVERPLTSMGIEITPPALLINHSGREYHSVLQPGFRSVEFMIDNGMIEDHPLGALLADARSRQDQTIIPLSSHLAASLRSAADAVVAATEVAGADGLGPGLLREVQSRALCTLALVLERHREVLDREVSVPVRGTVALAALREIERIGIHDVTIKGVCARLSVSRRAVEKSFKEMLGISPAQYVLACRLNKLRLALLGPAQRVADGLADSGFSDASRAARQYRRLFSGTGNGGGEDEFAFRLTSPRALCKTSPRIQYLSLWK